MASPRVSSDLLQPGGLLTPGMFPNLSSGDLDSMLMTFLNDGYERAADITTPTQPRKDQAATSWAYHMAYKVIWQRLSVNPATSDVKNQASQTYLQSQISTFEKLAAEQLSAFQTFFVEDTTIATANENTLSVPTTFSW